VFLRNLFQNNSFVIILMSLKKKKSVKDKNGKGSSGKNYFILTSDNKKQILGLFLLIISVILFLSIITFDRRDEASLTDLVTDFFNSFDQKIDIQNWLGVVGAHFALFMVKATFGYFSITIPIVLFLWGVSFFKTIDFKFRLHVSNFLLVSTIIFAAFFGVLRVNYDLFSSTYELSGFIGDHLGNFLSGLIGGIGSIRLLGFGFVTLLIFALDVDIKNILLFFKDVFSSESIEEDQTEETANIKEKENLEKIKKLSGEKKKKKTKQPSEELSAADLMEQEAEEQTKITIIRKDDVPVPEPENEVLNEEVKKVNIEKTGELAEKKEKTETEQEQKITNQ